MTEPKKESRTRYIGQWMPRLEDRRLITGQGRYTDDVSYPNQLYGIFVRSPHPHARIVSIDSAAARGAKGVIAVLTAEDFLASGARGVAHNANPADVIDFKAKAFDSGKTLEIPHLPFARDKVRYVGEPIALVVAQTVALARDAAELVEVAYEVLPQ